MDTNTPKNDFRGYVYMYRTLVREPVFSHPPRWQVFCYLVFTASYRGTSYNVNGKRVSVGRGQIVIGRINTSAKLGMKESTFRNQIAWLEKQGYISRKRVDSAYSIVTITNYDVYNYMPEGGWTAGGQPSGQGSGVDKELQRKGLAAFDKLVVDSGEDSKGSSVG